MTYPGSVPKNTTKYETGYEEAYIEILEDLRAEMFALKWRSGKQVFKECELGDVISPDTFPGCYVIYGSITPEEIFVGARSMLEHIPLTLIIRDHVMSPEDTTKKLYRYWGKINDAMKSKQSYMVTCTVNGTPTDIVQVNHRRVTGWRPWQAEASDQIGMAIDLICEIKTR